MDKLTNRLTSVLYNSDKVREYLDSFQLSVNTTESTLSDVFSKRSIAVAVGKQLDGCGNIVNEPRMGRSDDEYREAIYYRIFVNISTATPVDVNKAIRLLTKPDIQKLWEVHPAAFLTYSNGATCPSNISTMLKDISAAGIGAGAFFPSFGGKSYFLTSPNTTNTDGVDVGSGLGGISLPILKCNSKTLRLNGKRVRIVNVERQIIIGSGTALTGAYSI